MNSAMAFVTIFQTGDPILAEMLVDVLNNEGVSARLLGTRNGASIGVGQHILRLKIEVPSEQVAQGTEIVDAFERGEQPAAAEVEAASGAPPATEADEDEGPAARRKHPILAAGVSFVVPGGSHFYARRPWTAGLLLAGIVLAFFGLADNNRVDASAAALMLVGIVAVDLILGQLAVRAYNRGRRRGPLKQLAVGTAAVFAAWGLGFFVAPHLPHAKEQRSGFEFAEPVDLHVPEQPGGQFQLTAP